MAEQGFAVFLNLAAFCTGLGKAGLGALSGLVTPILLLPLAEPRLVVSLGTVLFVLGDLGAILYYLRSVRFALLLRLLPLSALGMLTAFLLGKYIATGLYLVILTLLSGLALGLLLYKHLSKNESRCYIMLLACGIVAGFTTVLGNVSGIFMNLYLSTFKLPKQGFVATMALYYLLVNVSKLLVYYFYWNSLDLSGWVWQQVLWALLSLVLGLSSGIFVVHKMSEQLFPFFVVLASLLAFVLLLWRTVEHFTIG